MSDLQALSDAAEKLLRVWPMQKAREAARLELAKALAASPSPDTGDVGPPTHVSTDAGLDVFIAETFASLRRRLVRTPPNVDSIDAAIGYLLNDCEAAIKAALR